MALRNGALAGSGARPPGVAEIVTLEARTNEHNRHGRRQSQRINHTVHSTVYEVNRKWQERQSALYTRKSRTRRRRGMVIRHTRLVYRGGFPKCVHFLCISTPFYDFMGIFTEPGEHWKHVRRISGRQRDARGHIGTHQDDLRRGKSRAAFLDTRGGGSSRSEAR